MHAYNTEGPTTPDLYRWSTQAARPLIDAAGLLPSGHTITGWTDLLGSVSTAGQFHGIASAVFEHNDGAVSRLHQFLTSAANWFEERGEHASSRRYRTLADQFDALADDMVLVTEGLARAAYPRSAAAAAPAPGAGTRPPAPQGIGTPPRR